MKILFLCGVLAFGPLGLIGPAWAQRDANLTKAPLKWPSIGPKDRLYPDAPRRKFDENFAAVQYFLRARGFYVGRVDGVYGPRTIAAVKAFQRKNGLKVDGVAGPKTLPKLVMTVKKGDRGDAVRAVQVLVRLAQDETGEMPNEHLKVDGVWGASTDKAVRIAQSYANEFEEYLVSDGVMGPRSWCILLGGSVVGSQMR